MQLSRQPIRVPRYLAPLAKKIRDVEKIVNKGLVIDSPTVKAQKQPSGRIQLRTRRSGGMWD
jgi:hypothetical protein